MDPNKPDAVDLVRCTRKSSGRIRKNNSGNLNSLNHITSHTDRKEYYHKSKYAIRTDPIDIHFIFEALKLFGWIRLIAQRNQPLLTWNTKRLENFLNGILLL